MDSWHLPAPRVLVGIGATLLAVVVLGVRACATEGEPADDPAQAETTTTVAVAAPVDPALTTTSSIVILPDWYPKQNSRYSEREPVVTVTTLQPTSSTSSTTTTTPAGAGASSPSDRSGSGGDR